MKLTIKLFLVISLFTSVAFAEGEMGGSGRTCTNNCFTVAQTSDEKIEAKIESEETILTYIQKYLDSIFAV